MIDRTPTSRDQRPPIPEFDPVPRKCPRHDGWTPERQRAFIEALADTGSVSTACRMVNMASEGAYQLRRQPGAEAFRCAWEAALDMGVQRLKDEAFERAMNGQLVPIFVAGKLMGFRRKKNDRLLMFCLRHYGQDPQGRRVTINYFSTNAAAGVAANLPLPASGERAGVKGMAIEPQAHAAAGTTAGTTHVTTTLAAPATDRLSREDEAAATLARFEGVPLDPQTQADILAALTACAERRRAVAPEDDPDIPFVAVEETETGYAGELETGIEIEDEDLIPFREGEPSWQGMGEGGQNAEIERAVASVEAHRALPNAIRKKRERAMDAEIEAQRKRQGFTPPCLEHDAGGGSDDPRLDRRNYREEE